MSRTHCLKSVLTLVLLLVLPASLLAGSAVEVEVERIPQQLDPVHKGLDLLASQPGTAADFSDNPIPDGFFGCSSGAYSGTVPLGGVSIAADQPMGATDTILERKKTVWTGTGATNLQVLALCLSNDAWTGPCGTSWSVTARLMPGVTQPITQLNMTRTSATGGNFGAQVDLVAEVTFTDNNSGFSASVADNVSLTTSGASWKETPGPGAATVSSPLTYDKDCDGIPDTTVNRGTTNFFAIGIVNHSGPHPAASSPGCIDADTQQLPDGEGLPGQLELCGEVIYRPAQQL